MWISKRGNRFERINPKMKKMANEEREGTIQSINDDSTGGKLKDRETGEERQFDNPARVDVRVGDDVIYVNIDTQEGKDVNIIKKKKG